MHTNQVDKSKMPFFDTFKTAAAVGLLMQQVSALPCSEGKDYAVSPYSIQLSAETQNQISHLMMNEALAFIVKLTEALNRAYTLLLEADDANRNRVIKTLNPEQTDLVELQLRGLEGAIRNVISDCSEEKKDLLKPSLMITAKARASAAKLNHLIAQMVVPVKVFHSEINMESLRALAKHGTGAFASEKFH